MKPGTKVANLMNSVYTVIILIVLVVIIIAIIVDIIIVFSSIIVFIIIFGGKVLKNSIAWNHALPITSSGVFCDGDSGKLHWQKTECSEQGIECLTFRLPVRVFFAMVTQGNLAKFRILRTRSQTYEILITSSYALTLMMMATTTLTMMAMTTWDLDHNNGSDSSSSFNHLIYGAFAACSVVNATAFSIKPWTEGKNQMDTKSRQVLSLTGFVAYLGFLNVLVAHSHPVMLVFCHLLINRDSDRGLKESLPQINSSAVALREQSYRTGMLYFKYFVVVVVVICRMTIDPRNIERRKDKAGCLFFSQCPVSRHLSGTPMG